MKPTTLLRLYPRWWRERYGDEFVALLEAEPMGFGVLADVVAGAFDAWMSPRMASANGSPVGPQILRIRRRLPRTARDRAVQAAVVLAAVTVLILLSATTDLTWTGSPTRRALIESAGHLTLAASMIPFWFAGYGLRTKIAAFVWTALLTFLIVRGWIALFP